MSMLARYKKPGGFLQLLSLIESFGPQKREKFMEMIHAEDAVWAQALQSKILTMERVLKWPEQTLTEIFRILPIKNLACVIKGIPKADSDKFLKYLSHAEKRKLDDEIGTLDPKPDDIFQSFVKVVEVVRKLVKEGELRLDKIDPSMILPEGYEEKLSAIGASPSHASHHGPQTHHAHAPAAETELVFEIPTKKKTEPSEPDGKASHDVLQLHRTLTAVTKENVALKEELRILREKLDQIRRIA